MLLGDVFSRLKAHSKRFGWFVREHVENRPHRARRFQASGRNLGVVRFGTWNINGLRRKSEPVRFRLSQRKLDVLAIQETLLHAVDPAFRLAGYQVFEARGLAGPSERGVALLIRKSLMAFVVGTSSPSFLFCKVTGKVLKRHMVVGSVYISHHDTASVVESFKRRLWNVVSHHATTCDIVVMGDFNAPRQLVEQWVQAVHPDFEVLGLSHGSRTRRDGRSVIDHICVLRGQHVKSDKAQAHNGFLASDHFPVTSRFRFKWDVPLEEDEPEWQRTVYSVRSLLTPLTPEAEEQSPPVINKFVNHNRFGVLAEECDELEEGDTEGLDYLAQKFVSTVESVGKECGMVHVQSSKNRSPFLLKSFLRFSRRLQDVGLRLESATDEAERVELLESRESLRRRMLLKLRQSKLLRFRKAVIRAERNIRLDPRAYWKWVKTRFHRASGSSRMLQPVVHPVTGRLCSNPREISEAWAAHYGGLASDVTGHSRNASHWQECLHSFPQSPQLAELDVEIKPSEVVQAIEELKYNKAPGSDRIQAEIF